MSEQTSVEHADKKFYRTAAEGLVLHVLVSNFTAFFQFIIALILIRGLSVSDYGIYSIILSAAGILGLAGTFFVYPLLRFVSDYFAEKEFYLAKKLMKIAVLYSAVAGFALMLLLLFFPNSIAFAFGNASLETVHLMFLGAILFVTYLTTPLEISLIAMLEQRVRNLARFVYTISYLGIVYLSIQLGWDLVGVLAGIIIAHTFLITINSVKLWKTTKTRPSTGKKEFGNQEKKRIINFSFPSMGANLADIFLNFTIDIFLVGLFLGQTAAAFYAFAVKIPTILISSSPGVLGTLVILPFVVNRYVRSNKRKTLLSYFFSVYFRFSSFFVIPLVLSMVLFAEPIILYIFKEQYLFSLPLFIVAAIASAVLGLRAVLLNLINILEKPMIGLYSKIWFLLSLGTAVYLLTNGFDLIYVITTTSAAFVFMWFTEFFLIRRHIALPIPWKGLGKILTGSAFLVLTGYFLLPFVNDALSLIAAGLASFAVFLLISFLLKPFSARDVEIFTKAGFFGRIMALFSGSEGEEHI